MGLIDSTIAFLFRSKAPKPTDAEHRQRTAAILRPIVDSAEDIASCLIDKKDNANDNHKASPAHRR